MGNKFNKRTGTLMRPKVCKSPPPPPHPEPPTPPTPLCTPVDGTMNVGTNGPISLGFSQTKVFRFIPPTTKTYVFGANLVTGFDAFNGLVKTDNVNCCAGGGAPLATFTVPTDGTSPVLTANTIYLVCVSNAFGTNSYNVIIT